MFADAATRCGSVFAEQTFSLISGSSQSGSHYVPPLPLPPSPSTHRVPSRARSESIDEKRTMIRRPRVDTAKCIGAGQAEGREGAGVIVLQNNLNFNYFGELQKRRCDSLTVCHRKINWLLLLPSSSTTFRAYEPLLSFSVSLSLLHIRCTFLYKVILK